MNFYKLSGNHKKWYIFNQVVILIMLGIALSISWSVNKVVLPTNSSKLIASTSFIMSLVFFALAVLNRVGSIFKIRSMGFIFIFVMFLGLKYIIDPVVWTVGLLTIPLLIDDMIFKPIWNNIWYNEYDGVVRIRD